jgi:DNA-binding transcriptional MerR regulator
VQVRTLAEAGVALSDIGDLLDADPERFGAAVAEVERQLDNRIRALVARRDMLHRLADGDRALLPDRACAVLDRLTSLGFDPDFVAAQREGLILARALAPEFFDGFVTQLEHRLDDPEYVELQKRGWEALYWDPDDPRLEELASAIADNLLTHREMMEAQSDFFSTPDATARYRLINNHRAEQMPSMTRLKTLIEAKLRAAGLDVPHP